MILANMSSTSESRKKTGSMHYTKQKHEFINEKQIRN